MRKDSFMIRFRETIDDARKPAIKGRPCQDNANRNRQTVLARMTDVMLELGFAGQDCDEQMLRLRGFSDAEIARHSPRAAEQARAAAIRQVNA